jgi:hypothetical protein
MPGYSQMLNEPLIAVISNASFTGPTDVTSSTTQPPLSIGAYSIQEGASIRTTAFGNFSTTATPTLVIGPYWGTTVLGVNVALTTASGAATLPWRLETTTSFHKVGSAGVARTQGTLVYGTTLTAVTTIPVPGIALADVTVDTTASALWTVKATWSASSASNIVTTSGFYVELLNATP